MREKLITAISQTIDGIEWTSLRLKEGSEIVQQGELLRSSTRDDGRITPTDLPDGLEEKVNGDMIVSLHSSELLLHIVQLPAEDPTELADMIPFQVDKISPFALDEMAISHEVLEQNEGTSTTLVVAAKKQCIDEIGDAFDQRNIRIHSIDARILGWLQLLNDAKHIPSDKNIVLILHDGIDFSMVFLRNGIPISIRNLHPQGISMPNPSELAFEVEYLLTVLDVTEALEPPQALHYWSVEPPEKESVVVLEEKCGLRMELKSLAELPPLSEGLVRRAAQQNRIELIPREWIEHEERKKLTQQFIRAMAMVGLVWLVLFFILIVTFRVRKVGVEKYQEIANQLEQPAKQAKETRKKRDELYAYSDRSRSPLECLREVTERLPTGDIDFNSFNYSKNKVSLRGSSDNSDLPYTFIGNLSSSELFVRPENQSVNKTSSRGASRYQFSVTLPIQGAEEDQP